MPKPTKVRILEYLYTVSSIPRKQLKLAFQDVAYNTVFRATKELLDSGYIELLSVSKGPTRIKITKAGMDYLSKQKDAVMQANIRSTVTSSSKKERIERVQKRLICVWLLESKRHRHLISVFYFLTKGTRRRHCY